MTSAAAETLTAPAVDVDEVVSVVVRILLARDRITIEELAARSGISRDVLFRRLRHNGNTSWKASEVALLAAYFKVPVSEFFDPSGPLLGGVAGGFRKAPFLTLVPEQRQGAHDDNSADAPAA